MKKKIVMSMGWHSRTLAVTFIYTKTAIVSNITLRSCDTRRSTIRIWFFNQEWLVRPQGIVNGKSRFHGIFRQIVEILHLSTSPSSKKHCRVSILGHTNVVGWCIVTTFGLCIVTTSPDNSFAHAEISSISKIQVLYSFVHFVTWQLRLRDSLDKLQYQITTIFRSYISI